MPIVSSQFHINASANLSFRANGSSSEILNLVKTNAGNEIRLSIPNRGFFGAFSGPDGGTVFRNQNSGQSTWMKLSAATLTTGGTDGSTRLEFRSGNSVTNELERSRIWFTGRCIFSQVFGSSGIRWRIDGQERMRTAGVSWLVNRTSAWAASPFPFQSTARGRNVSNNAALTINMNSLTPPGGSLWPMLEYRAPEIGVLGRFEGNNNEFQFRSGSDYRRKTNIEPLIDVGSRLAALKPRQFRMVNDASGTINFGFVAHEFAQALPLAVIGHKDQVDEDGRPIYQKIDQIQTIPVLVSALQKIHRDLDALRNHLQAQRG